MVLTKMKGYRTERKIRIFFEKFGWKVVRAGASLGDADLICIRSGKCILLQVKSTRKKTFYYYGYMRNRLEGFPFYVVVDFGYNKIKILHPKKRIEVSDGIDLRTFLRKV